MDILEEHIPVFEEKLFTKRLFNKERKGWIVLLHDALGSVEQWKTFPELLFDLTNCNVLVYDRTGYGQSSGSVLPRFKAYMHIEAELWLPEVLKVYGIKKPIILGHSDGASIALLYANKNNCKALISVAGHVYVEELTVQSIAKAEKNKKKTIQQLEKYHGEKAEAIFYGWFDLWQTHGFSLWNILGSLHLRDLPTLIIQGSKDEYGTWNQVKDIALKANKHKVVELSNVGHMPHLDSPSRLAKHSVAFINPL